MPAKHFEEIRSLPLFKAIDETSFSALVRGAYVQSYPPHTELITEGEAADFLHIVASGTVELFSSWSERESSTAFLGPHSTFIIAATIKDRPYLMSARTLNKARIIRIPSEDIRDVFESDSDFAKSIVTELAGCYRDSVKTLKNIKLRTAVERLANYIVKHLHLDGGSGELILDVEKRKLASYLGMTPENLSRSFQALKTHGIEVNGQSIYVKDTAKLRAFAKPDSLIDE